MRHERHKWLPKDKFSRLLRDKDERSKIDVAIKKSGVYEINMPVPLWKKSLNLLHDGLREMGEVAKYRTLEPEGLSEKDYYIKEISFIEEVNIKPVILIGIRNNHSQEALDEFVSNNPRVITLRAPEKGVDVEDMKSEIIQKTLSLSINKDLQL